MQAQKGLGIQRTNQGLGHLNHYDTQVAYFKLALISATLLCT